MPEKEFSLGAVILAARRKAGLRQHDIAARVGVSKPSVWAWEHNRSTPTDDKLEKLAEVLDIPLNNLRASRFMAHEMIIARCRSEIAAALSVAPQAVKISLEL